MLFFSCQRVLGQVRTGTNFRSWKGCSERLFLGPQSQRLAQTAGRGGKGETQHPWSGAPQPTHIRRLGERQRLVPALHCMAAYLHFAHRPYYRIGTQPCDWGGQLWQIIWPLSEVGNEGGMWLQKSQSASMNGVFGDGTPGQVGSTTLLLT